MHEDAPGLQAGELELERRIVRMLSSAIHQVVEVGVPDRLDEQLADGIGSEQEHRAERRIDEDDVPIAIDDDDALVHGLEDPSLEITALGAQLAEVVARLLRHAVERVPELGELVVARKARPDLEIALGLDMRRAASVSSPTAAEHPLGDDVREDERRARAR